MTLLLLGLGITLATGLAALLFPRHARWSTALAATGVVVGASFTAVTVTCRLSASVSLTPPSSRTSTPYSPPSATSASNGTSSSTRIR